MSTTTATPTPYILTDQHVTVPDADEPHGLPEYDGLASRIGRHLSAGVYPATTLDGVPVYIHLDHGQPGRIVLDQAALTTLLAEERAYLGSLLRKMRGASSVALAATLRSRADDQRVHVEMLATTLRQASPCAACARGDLPSHTPSSGCRSGKRPHCSCSACF